MFWGWVCGHLAGGLLFSQHTRQFSDRAEVQNESGTQTWQRLEMAPSPLEGEWGEQVFSNPLFAAGCTWLSWVSEDAVGFSKCLDSGNLPSLEHREKSWAGESPQESILSAKSQKDLEVLGILCHVPWPLGTIGREEWRPGWSLTLYTCRQVP